MVTPAKLAMPHEEPGLIDLKLPVEMRDEPSLAALALCTGVCSGLDNTSSPRVHTAPISVYLGCVCLAGECYPSEDSLLSANFGKSRNTFSVRLERTFFALVQVVQRWKQGLQGPLLVGLFSTDE